MALSMENVQAVCSLVPDSATKGFFMQQTMLRIKDPRTSLDFYTRVLGMTLIKKLDFSEMKFSLYFLGYVDASRIPDNKEDALLFCFNTPGTIELTHNWGTEQEEGLVYHNGNTDPKGFGHIGIAVPDVEKACARFESLGVIFAKKPNDGKMKGLAFITDPDGYWIEIFNPQSIKGLAL